MWGLLFFSLIAVFFNSCEPYYKKFDITHDNLLEEIFEDILEFKTGVDIDITPSSKEL